MRVAAYEGVGQRLRRRPWELGLGAFAVLSVPASISLIVDLLVNQQPSWSIIVVSALALLCLFIGLPPFVFRGHSAGKSARAVLLISLYCCFTWVFLLIVDCFDGAPTLDWAPGLGAVLLLLTGATVTASVISLQRGRRRRGAVELFIWISLYNFGIELSLSYYLYYIDFFGWSFIVAASLLPIGLAYGLILFVARKSERVKRRIHM